MTSATNLYFKTSNLLGLDNALNLCDFIYIMNHLRLIFMNMLKFANYVEKKFAPQNYWLSILAHKI
jgi:hypothetical protein